MGLYSLTTATKKILRLTRRIRAVQGGTSASKTISILMILIDMAQADQTPTLTSVVSESMPHLRKGAMRDFRNIMMAHKYWREANWNASNSIYTFESGSQIEFFGADMPDKVRGPRRDRLFINECNNIPYESYDQLEVRTRQTIWLDWNPTTEFWFYTELQPMRPDDIDFITITYKDNEALDAEIVKSIEARKGNKNWWLVYGLGQLGEAEGRIYTGWQIIDEIPHEAQIKRRGLDYGYSNDPTAVVALYYHNGGWILDEELYQKGMQNDAIADFIKNLVHPNTLLRPDNNEPKSNDELKSRGINLLPAAKGKGSILQGIQFVQKERISVTKRSTNLIKEYRNYMWLTDPKTGKTINEPMDDFNHCMDAIRYAFEDLKGKEPEMVIIGYEEGLGGAQIPIYAFRD